MNSVNIIGRLTAESEIKFLNTGTAISKFCIAVDKYNGKDKENTTYYFDVVLWGKQAEALNKFLVKGIKVGVCGELRQETWEKDGKKNSKIVISATSIDLLERKEKQSEQPKRGETYSYHKGQVVPPESFKDDADDFPF